MDNRIIIIDVQGFNSSKTQFILKELAIQINNDEPICFLVKPPFPIGNLKPTYRRQVEWLMTKYHGLNWNDGSTTYKSVINFLKENLKNNVKIYVKGAEKKTWLQEELYVKCVRDLGDYDCLNLKKLAEKYPNESSCSKHFNHCALKNVRLLKKFLENEINN